MIASPDSFADTVQKAYIAYYGRPADTGGLTYWENQIAQQGSLSAIMQTFGNSDEAKALYGNSSISLQIANIYQQLFNRAPDAAGLNYYSQQVQNGTMTLQTVALNVLDGASGSDSAIIQSKLAVASNFTAQLTQSGTSTYSGSTAADNARKYLSTIDGSSTTESHAKSIATLLISDLNGSVDSDLAEAGLTPTTSTTPSDNGSTTSQGIITPIQGTLWQAHLTQDQLIFLAAIEEAKSTGNFADGSADIMQSDPMGIGYDYYVNLFGTEHDPIHVNISSDQAEEVETYSAMLEEQHGPTALTNEAFEASHTYFSNLAAPYYSAYLAGQLSDWVYS